jgi:hypothetical protein
MKPTKNDIERRLEEAENDEGSSDGVTDAALGVTAPFVTYEADSVAPKYRYEPKDARDRA